MAAQQSNREKVGGERAFEVTPADSVAATGSIDQHLGLTLIRQAASATWMPSTMTEDERRQALKATLGALKGLTPRGELEGMLAVQMVATHNAAMECLRRAMYDEQTLKGHNHNLKHAARLLGIYARQVEALDKHRGKGQRKINVERVTVNAGGQAIVGNVTTNAVASGSGASGDTGRRQRAGRKDPGLPAAEFSAAKAADPDDEAPQMSGLPALPAGPHTAGGVNGIQLARPDGPSLQLVRPDDPGLPATDLGAVTAADAEEVDPQTVEILGWPAITRET